MLSSALPPPASESDLTNLFSDGKIKNTLCAIGPKITRNMSNDFKGKTADAGIKDL